MLNTFSILCNRYISYEPVQELVTLSPILFPDAIVIAAPERAQQKVI